MKVLIVGYGSIGKRHKDVLANMQLNCAIDVVTKQNLESVRTFPDLRDVVDLHTYDYFVLASETNKHYEQLKFLEERVFGKTILCEKPLFDTQKNLQIKSNLVFVGYVLRFHPLLQKLRDYLLAEKTYSAHVICGQYLPTWRPNVDYRDSYSAKKHAGGGVLLDLSHELDYIQWLFGQITEVKSYQAKISDLEIDSDDITTLVGKTEQQVLVNISMDYISKITQRKLCVHTAEHSYELDFVTNSLLRKSKRGLEEVFSFTNLERNYMFEQMHLDALGEHGSICNFSAGVMVMNTITMIQSQNELL